MKPAPRLLTLAGLVLACAATGQVASARQAAPEVVQTPEARAVAQMVTAAELAAWGRERRDPDALMVAARMLDEVPLRVGSGGDAGVTPVLSAQSLRQEASALRPDHVTIDEIVVSGSRLRAEAERAAREQAERDRAAREARAPAQRQPAPAAPPPPPPSPPPPPPPPAMVGVQSSPFGDGPVSTVKRLGSRESWSFDIDARGAEILRIAAIGDGDTDVDLTVRDVSGKILCADGFGDHYPVCTLSPGAPARLRVDVVNRGALWTRVQVLTN